MQHNRSANMDGFVVRRRAASGMGQIRPRRPDISKQGVPEHYLTSSARSHTAPITAGAGTSVHASVATGLPAPKRPTLDLDLTLEPENPARGREKRLKTPRKKLFKRIAVILVVLLLAVGGYFGYKFFNTSGKIFKGNIITAIFNEGKELKTDANGRANFLLFGTSEDDPGHPGGELTDSIMVASLDPKKKDVFLVSIPRDLYVDYGGMACISGYKGRVNDVYQCNKYANNEAGDEEAGASALRKKAGEIFGLEVQYSVHINYTALRQAVDAVGGINVTIESKDPRGILDRNFDWDCPKPYSCYNVKYPNGPVALNGKQALYLARARGAQGATYGLEQSNFNREEYQRKILIALKDKAASAGTLANPVAVSSLMDALGNNVRTNIAAEEIKTLVKIGQDLKNENIRSISLVDPEKPLVGTGADDGTVRPLAGAVDYTAIHAVVKAHSTGDMAALENAKVDVLNASGTPGLAQKKADELELKDIRIEVVGNTATGLGTQPVQIFDTTKGKKPATRQKLEQLLGVKASDTLPPSVATASDFVVIIGVQPQSTPAQ